MNRAPQPLRIFVSAVCVYEIAALWTDLPTISHLVRRHPWTAPVITGVLSYHFQPEARF